MYMDHLVEQEVKKLQRTRDLALVYTSSLLAGSAVIAKQGAFFADYFPLFKEELQKTEQFLAQPGMGLACILTAGMVYVSGIATLIYDYYGEKIENAGKSSIF